MPCDSIADLSDNDPRRVFLAENLKLTRNRDSMGMRANKRRSIDQNRYRGYQDANNAMV
ncbi:hypothetical protein RMSM_07461 [Rhodopirellula maiorica SM1]|uniref:Uncharacterized protein n=1 Tax=Rhodopirellula maiorica SM1 TaxID=1265738 RepID=M5R8B8_9BACT|nr:hypothetical protein RMSM_07461 [Rhodopirellula maiorica SM1]